MTTLEVELAFLENKLSQFFQPFTLFFPIFTFEKEELTTLGDKKFLSLSLRFLEPSTVQENFLSEVNYFNHHANQ